MLVLSRKKYEAIVIDERITVTIVEVNGNTVRLGIEAPREIPVHRLEVSQSNQIRQRQREVAGGNSSQGAASSAA